MTNPQQPNHQPNYSQSPGSKSRDKTIAIVVGAVVLVLVLVVGGYFIAVKGGEAVGKGIAKEVTGGVSDQTNGSTTPSGDYSKIDPNALTVDQFYDDVVYPEEYRINWADKIIKERTPDAIPAINRLLAQGNRDPLYPYVQPSLENSGLEILTQQTIVGYIASVAVTPDEGRKLLAASYHPDNPGLDTTMGQIGGGQKPIVGTFQVWTDNSGKAMESPTFKTLVVGGYSPGGVPSKLLLVNNKLTQVKTERFVQFKYGRWITVKTITTNDPNWVVYPENIPAGS
ncbi:hypothetical protein HWD35_10340 [Tsukamurella tyrosinosolvens]|uniref:hypothetical protein n=1 Tax=Tsukamurella tyrosinosolvens TaxID=57704 RepID=UPI001CE03F8A|nr:hypothetical protein [Tsukamurella tyrosinosolvens]MCA4995110.1 hypothetical protein [Tsukamurella tyrosinosolvens]